MEHRATDYASRNITKIKTIAYEVERMTNGRGPRYIYTTRTDDSYRVVFSDQVCESFRAAYAYIEGALAAIPQ